MNNFTSRIKSFHDQLLNKERYDNFKAARKKLLLFGGLKSKEKKLLKKISLRVSEDDNMYVPSYEYHYLSVGLSAITNIDKILDKVPQKIRIKSILDFPCGYGRVLRALKVRFPQASIRAVEIEQEYLDFCRDVFSVSTSLSEKDISKLSITGKYDLIWCGSLFTHINETSAADLLKLFYNKLSKNGVCVFTTHGQLPINWLKKNERDYGLSKVAVKSLLSQYRKTGYGYANYPDSEDYGISVVSHARMSQLAKKAGKWEEILHIEHGWDNHQDVYGFIRNI